MPILSGLYISNLHLIEYARPFYGNNTAVLLDNFEQKQSNSLSPVKMIQGTVGTRAMAVGGIVWETSLTGNALVYRLNDSSANSDGVGDLLDLIFTEWQYTIQGGQQIVLNNPNLKPVTSILEKASINISKESVNCTANFKSDYSTAFNILEPSIAVSRTSNLIARTARWYDCSVLMQSLATNWQYNSIDSPVRNLSLFAVESASITLSGEVGERYFISGNQEPYLNVNGYSISGTFTLVGTKEQLQLPSNQILYQPGGYLQLTGPTNIALRVGNRDLALGTASMLSVYNISVKAGDVMKFRIDFTSYTV